MIQLAVRSLFLLFCFTILGQTPQQSYFEWTSMPFSKKELAQRRENLMDQIPSDGLVLIPAKDGYSDGETFRQLDDFYYFTGLELPNSILVLNLANSSATIYTPEFDQRFHSDTRPNDFPGRPLLNDQKISEQSGLQLVNIDQFPKLLDSQLMDRQTIFLNQNNTGDIAFNEYDYLISLSPVDMLKNTIAKKHIGWKFRNMYDAIAKVRMVKSPAEIEIMRKATAINVAGIKTAAKAIKAGIDERYLEGILEGSYKLKGAQRLAFGSIIKSGPNSLWPWRILATHYNRRNRILQNGELVIFDVGCEYQQYVSDVGRTFPVSGKFTQRQREILSMEVGIADHIIDFIKPGITFADIRKVTDAVIPEKDKNYMQVSLYFGHHLGLSAGDPSLTAAKLEPGMIFTVEPWYYNHDEQLSVFTEDVILVTEEGCEVFSQNLPRTPEDLEKLMQN